MNQPEKASVSQMLLSVDVPRSYKKQKSEETNKQNNPQTRISK